MAKKEETFDDVFSDDNIPESNWYKFEKPGDKVAGVVLEINDRPGKGVFGPSRVWTLKRADETVINVSIPLNKDYVIGRANSAKLGDILGFEFKKSIPSQTKGFAPSKSLEVYVKHMEVDDGFGGL